MIAVDSSAIVAVALAEPDAPRYIGPLEASVCIVGWPTLLEVHMVLHRYRKPLALEGVESWQARANPRMTAFDGTLFAVATDAFSRYGKGTGHPAQLNFGDCMAYAVAKVNDVPLLYKGTDFAKTDIKPAFP